MRELEVVGVRVQVPDNQPVVLLREVAGRRFLPIWIGAPEASAISLAQQGAQPPRPMTHDLLKEVLTFAGLNLVEVRISSMVEAIFHAELVFDDERTVSSRASDAIAVALRVGCPIMVSDTVLDEGGVEMQDEAEDEVEKFREFLDQVSAEDFLTDPDSTT